MKRHGLGRERDLLGEHERYLRSRLSDQIHRSSCGRGSLWKKTEMAKARAKGIEYILYLCVNPLQTGKKTGSLGVGQ